MSFFSYLKFTIIFLGIVACRIGGLKSATGGLMSVSASGGGQGLSNFEITLTVQCPSSNQISCIGTIFEANGTLLTTYTSQNTCESYSNSTPFVSQANTCILGTTYSLNFFCLNQTTGVILAWGPGAAGTNGENASFTCS